MLATAIKSSKSARILLIAIAFCVAIPTVAKPRVWQDAMYTREASSSQNAGMAAVPVGTSVYALNLSATWLYYRFETPDMIYVASQRCYNGAMKVKYKCPLNITLNAKAKIAIDGRKIHVLDDDGKDVELDLALKEARQEPNKP